MYSKRTILTLLLFIIVCAECSDILAIFNIPSKSLHLAAISMGEILASKGHNVTLVTAYKSDGKNSSFTHIFLKDTAEINERTYTNFFDFDMDPYSTLYSLEAIGVENCKATFEDRAFKKLLRSNQKFDLLILDSYMSYSLLYLSEYFNVPVLIYSSFDSGHAINSLVGNPSPPSYIPSIFLHYSSNMSFLERLHNALFSVYNELIFNFFTLPKHDEVVKTYFPDAPDISQYLHKASIILLNSDLSIMYPTPVTPGIVHIGGFHIDQPKPLPGDLEKIMNNAQHGVILFSLGSNIKSSQMPKSRVEEILSIFSRLKETIIWKWEDEDVPGKPSNVIMRKWLPQNDILAHKNLKLFITHGGQHSILETIYYAIPCLSISVFMDQGANSFRAKTLGFAEWIRYKDFTAEKFDNSLRSVLSNPSFVKAAEKRSKIMRDKQITPRENIAFWVDYVIRHKGIEHLRIAGLKLNWYQYLLLDVVLFVFFCLCLILYTFKFVMKLFILGISQKQSKNKKE